MCESGYSVSYKADKHFGEDYHSFRTVEQIATEIMTNGPVEGSMRVYADFLQYKSGELQYSRPVVTGVMFVCLVCLSVSRCVQARDW